MLEFEHLKKRLEIKTEACARLEDMLKEAHKEIYKLAEELDAACDVITEHNNRGGDYNPEYMEQLWIESQEDLECAISELHELETELEMYESTDIMDLKDELEDKTEECLELKSLLAEANKRTK